MVINNYEINSAYQGPQPESHSTRVLVIIIILAVAGFLYYSYSGKKVEAPVEQPAPVVETKPEPVEVISVDDLDADISAVLQSDDSDMNAISAEFK